MVKKKGGAIGISDGCFSSISPFEKNENEK